MHVCGLLLCFCKTVINLWVLQENNAPQLAYQCALDQNISHIIMILIHLGHSVATHLTRRIFLLLSSLQFICLVVPVLTYLLAKKELTLEEVYMHTEALLGAGVDTVSMKTYHCHLASFSWSFLKAVYYIYAYFHVFIDCKTFTRF